MTEKDATVAVELEITGADGGVVSPGVGNTLRVMTAAADARDVFAYSICCSCSKSVDTVI